LEGATSVLAEPIEFTVTTTAWKKVSLDLGGWWHEGFRCSRFGRIRLGFGFSEGGGSAGRLDAQGGEFKSQSVFAPGAEGVEAASKGAVGAVGLALEKFEDARGVGCTRRDTMADGGFVAGGLRPQEFPVGADMVVTEQGEGSGVAGEGFGPGGFQVFEVG
jgi:hypothetical protein